MLPLADQVQRKILREGVMSGPLMLDTLSCSLPKVYYKDSAEYNKFFSELMSHRPHDWCPIYFHFLLLGQGQENMTIVDESFVAIAGKDPKH